MPRLRMDSEPMLFKAFCDCCPAKLHVPVRKPSFKYGVDKTLAWIDRCPAAFVVGDAMCAKAGPWRLIEEGIEKAKSYGKQNDLNA